MVPSSRCIMARTWSSEFADFEVRGPKVSDLAAMKVKVETMVTGCLLESWAGQVQTSLMF